MERPSVYMTLYVFCNSFITYCNTCEQIFFLSPCNRLLTIFTSFIPKIRGKLANLQQLQVVCQVDVDHFVCSLFPVAESNYGCDNKIWAVVKSGLWFNFSIQMQKICIVFCLFCTYYFVLFVYFLLTLHCYLNLSLIHI